MARRKKDDNIAGSIAQLVALVLLLGGITPQGRQFVSALGALAVLALVVAFLALIGFVIYRLATRSKRLSVAVASPFTVSHDVLIPSTSITARSATSHTPQPREVASVAARPNTTGEVVAQLRKVDWFQFEKIVASLYRKQGYSVTRKGGANPDGGIDLTIQKSGETWAVQCKQWKAWNVGVKAIREFLGALTDAGIQKGAFITLRGYTGEAKQLADKHGIEIVNEAGLAAMLTATDARFDPEVLELLQDKRKFCPKCECLMVLRPTRRGPNVGQTFWGCSSFPRCRFTLPADQD